MKKLFIFLLTIFINSVLLSQNDGEYIYSFVKFSNPDSSSIMQIHYVDSSHQDTLLVSEYFFPNNNIQIDTIVQDPNPFQMISSTSDMLTKTVSLNNDSEGALPLELCANANYNKLYAYHRGRKVVILNKTNGEIIGSSLVSNTDYLINDNYLRSFPYEKNLAYNDTRDKLYCVTPTNTLKIFSGTDESLITELSPPMDYKNAFHNLIYENDHDKLFWAINYGAGHDSLNKIKVIDGQTNIVEAEYTFSSNLSAINDILINPNDPDIIFISDNRTLYVMSYNYVSKTFSFLNSYSFMDTQFGKLSYNSINNKLYVNNLDHYELLVFNGFTGAFDHIITVPFQRVYKNDFNPTNNKLYFTGGQLNNDGRWKSYFYILSCDEEHISSIMFNCNGLFYNPTENVVYVSNFYDEINADPKIKMFDGETEDEIKSIVNNGGGGSVSMYYNNSNERLIVGNNNGGSVSVFDKNLNEVEQNPISTFSTNAVQGLYDDQNDKLYVPNYNTANTESALSVVDGSTEQISDIIKTDRHLKNLVLNRKNQKLFLTHYKDSKVSVVDCNTNQVSTINTTMLPDQIISTNEDYVFVGCHNQIDVIDASSGSVISNISISGEVKDFEFYGNHIYALTSSNANKYLIAININNLQIDNEIEIYYQEPIKCKAFNNKLYCIRYNNFTKFSTIDIYDLQDDLNLLKTYPLPLKLKNIQISHFSQNKYFMGYNNYGHKIIILDENDLLSNDEIYIPNGKMIDMLYNEINNRLYVFWEKQDLISSTIYKPLYMNIYNTNNNSYLSTIDLQQNDAYFVTQNSFSQNGISSLFYSNNINFLVLNNNQNKLYVLNGNFSNISVIECTPEQAVYHSGYNWISFPRLDRSNGNPSPESVLGGMVPDPVWLTMYGLLDKQEDQISIHKENSNWTGNLNEIESQRGYKLELPEDPTGGCGYVLDMTGTRLDPSTSIDVYEGYENWVGYFIPRTQDIFDALGSTADNLLEIYHQDWTCIYTEYPWFDPQPPQPEPKWYCDNQQHNISYGEMVVLKPKSDLSFQWNNPVNPSQGSSTNNPAYYTYEEQAGYSVFIVELDTTENPVEIGAFAGDTCIGASSVSANDTLSVMRVYTGNNPGDSVVFEEHYASRVLQDKRIVDYYVYNTEKNMPEKRVIRTGEKKDVFFVSFRNRKKDERITEGAGFRFSVYPNPAAGMLNIEYTLPAETRVVISIFDMYGQKVGTVMQAIQQSGTKKVRWNPADASGMKLEKGVYLLKLKTAYGSAGQKVVIN